MFHIACLALAYAATVFAACGGSAPPSVPASPPADTGGWEKIYDRPADSATAIEMYDDEFGLAIIGHGIERTTDGGQTWHETDSADDFIGPIAIADRDHAWVVGAGGVLLHTTDGGMTWTRQETGTDAPLTHLAAVSADEAWVAGYAAGVQGYPPHGASALLHTVDGGAAWRAVDVPGYGIFIGLWFVGQDGWLLASSCHPGDPIDDPNAEPGAPGHAPCRDQTAMLHSPHDGQSWEALTDQAGLNAYYHQIARVDALHAYAVGDQGLYFTSDGGHTWDAPPPFAPNTGITDMRFTSQDDGWIMVVQCGLAINCDFVSRLEHTTDGGESWDVVDVPGDISGAFSVASDGTVTASTPGSGISIYDSRQRAWEAASTDARPELTQISFTTRDEGAATTYDGDLWVTDDGGETWSPRSDGRRWNIASTGVLWAFYPDDVIHLSLDRGATWRDVPPPPRSPGTIELSVEAVDGDRIWVALYDGLWRTDDAGKTWRHIDTAQSAQYHFIDPLHVWTASCGPATCDGAIRVSSDGGDTWELRPLAAGVGGVVFATPDEGWADVSTTPPGGKYVDCLCHAVTHDGGRTWQVVSTAPWSLSDLAPIDDQRAFAIGTTSLSLDVPPDVISTSDGGATWQKEFSLETPRGGFGQPRLVARDGQIWLVDETSRVNPVDGGYDPPRRTIIYRRDIEPAATGATASPPGN
jgi:photosystem II stability/assembly factor-like uncharacterized protein